MAVIARPLSALSGAPVVRAITLDGPAAAIVRREVGRMLQERAFRFLALGLTGLNLVVAYTWYADPGGSPDLEKAARQILYSQLLLLYAVGFVFTAARAGTCIGTERARNTWEMMWLAPAHPLSLALGHIAAALAPASLLTISQLPVLAPAIYAVGAEEWGKIGATAVIGGVSWVACAAWAFLASARCRRFGYALAGTFAAALWSSGVLAAVLFGVIMTLVIRSGGAVIPTAYGIDVIQLASPAMQLYHVVNSGLMSVPLSSHIATMVGTALIPVALGAWAVHREKEAITRRSERQNSARSTVPAARRSRSFTGTPDWWNPIFAAERRIAAAGRSRAVVVLFVLLSGFSLLVSFRTTSAGALDDASEGISLLAFLLLGLAAWSTASGIVASRELETFDMVAMTGLRPRDILLRKTLAALVSVFPLAALLAACMAIAGYRTDAAGLMIVAYLSGVLCIGTLMSSGLFASVVARGTREAVASNILIGLIMHAGVPILAMGVYIGAQEAIARNWLGLQRWLTPSNAYSDTYNFLAGGSSLIGGLGQLLSEPQSWRARTTWAVSVMVGIVWISLWYCAAAWLLQRQLNGLPLWRPRVKAE